jgi:hypothetical protein
MKASIHPMTFGIIVALAEGTEHYLCYSEYRSRRNRKAWIAKSLGRAPDSMVVLMVDSVLNRAIMSGEGL